MSGSLTYNKSHLRTRRHGAVFPVDVETTMFSAQQLQTPSQREGDSGRPGCVPLDTHALRGRIEKSNPEAELIAQTKFLGATNQHSHSIWSKAFSASNAMTASGTRMECEV